MTTTINKGPIVDPGLCRCCGAAKKCRILNVEYKWIGQTEIYSDMFMDTFGLLLSHLDGEQGERLICATCVTRLREAASFRHQVLACEEKLLQTKIHGEDNDSSNLDKCIKKEEDSVDPVSGCDADYCNDSDTANVVDDEVSGTEDKKEAKRKPRQLKKIKKTKEAKSKTKRTNHDKDRKKMLVKLKTMNRELKKIQELDNHIYDEPLIKDAPKLDSEHIALHNTVSIVENSFVCPFDTSFSDYYCVYCKEIFIDPNKLREHTLTHDPATYKDIYNNKKTSQIDIYRINCRLCPETITEIDEFKVHLVKAHGKMLHQANNEFLKFKLTDNLSCIECGMSFSFFHALKKHMAEHFGSFVCYVCGAHYFEERMLILHQKSHQRVEDKEYPCKECGKTFKSNHTRYLHEAKTHKKEPAYQCSKCDEVLFSYTLRYRHMIEVHGVQRNYKCDHCDRAYDSRKSLREHNRRSHLKILKHQCDLCDKRFYLPSRLKEHIATHTGERNFRCEYCGKSYPRLRGLKVHMQSHSSEKKFRCVLCNASFTQNVNLKNHMKRQHQSLDIEEGFND